MSTAAIFAQGTLLQIGDGATSEAFTTIAEVMDLKGPNVSLDPIDVTNHDSTDGWKEFIGGLLDGGEATFSINYQPIASTHDQLNTDLQARVLRNFLLVFTDASSTTWAFSALVTALGPSTPVDKQLTADVTLKISGKPTLS